MATLNQGTVNDALERISDLRGENSTNTDANRVRAVSWQERELAKRFLSKLFLLPNQTETGTGSNTYTLGSATYPVHEKGLSELFVGDTTEPSRYKVVDYFNFKDLYNRDNTTKLAYQYFDVVSNLWKMHISPAPEVSEPIFFSYFWMPPKRTSSSDTLVYFSLDAVSRLALADLYEGEDEDDKAFDQRTIAEQIINDALSVENTTPVGQNKSMGSSSNSGRTRGFGTY